MWHTRGHSSGSAVCLACAEVQAANKAKTPRARCKATDGVTTIARRLCIGVYRTRLRWTQAAIRVTAQQRRAAPTTVGVIKFWRRVLESHRLAPLSRRCASASLSVCATRVVRKKLCRRETTSSGEEQGADAADERRSLLLPVRCYRPSPFRFASAYRLRAGSGMTLRRRMS